jgi:hypothetical protein
MGKLMGLKLILGRYLCFLFGAIIVILLFGKILWILARAIIPPVPAPTITM